MLITILAMVVANIDAPELSFTLHQAVRYDVGKAQKGVRGDLFSGHLRQYSDQMASDGGTVIADVAGFCEAEDDLTRDTCLSEIDDFFRRPFNDVVFVIPPVADFTKCIENCFARIEHKITSKTPFNSISVLTEQQSDFLRLTKEGNPVIVTKQSPVTTPHVTSTPIWLATIDSSKPTNIVVSSSYGAITAFPTLKRGGLGWGGSGVVAVRELHQIFSKIFSSRSIIGMDLNTNMLFSVDGGGRFSYSGLTSIVSERLSPRNKTTFTLCVEDLIPVHNKTLFVHKTPRSGGIDEQFLKRLSSKGFSIISKRQSYSSAELELPHHLLEHNNIPSVSITGYHKQSPHILRYNDMRLESDEVIADYLLMSISEIAESLLFIVFSNLSDHQVAALRPLITPLRTRILSSVTSLSSAEYFQTAESVSKVLGSDFHKTDVPIVAHKSSIFLYSIPPVDAQLYSSKPAFFDMALTCIVALFLTVIYKIGGKGL
eukprot:TRINITY_DN4230_c1_g1_i1.p1 TRINITY_DN4230_c1_g1~~TRINITY_DN4230_c1_g1_i1.p1  ORF type:complete len:486 (+),score=88.50 TRINITY_DN4230_c1_g1_i1:182-1639(+)